MACVPRTGVARSPAHRDDAVHVIGQHHPGVDTKRPLAARAPDRLAEGVDVPHQRVRFPLEQID